MIAVTYNILERNEPRPGTEVMGLFGLEVTAVYPRTTGESRTSWFLIAALVAILLALAGALQAVRRWRRRTFIVREFARNLVSPDA
jgi:LPXTG-motif cell wall-anchored protein